MNYIKKIEKEERRNDAMCIPEASGLDAFLSRRNQAIALLLLLPCAAMAAGAPADTWSGYKSSSRTGQDPSTWHGRSTCPTAKAISPSCPPSTRRSAPGRSSSPNRSPARQAKSNSRCGDPPDLNAGAGTILKAGPCYAFA